MSIVSQDKNAVHDWRGAARGSEKRPKGRTMRKIRWGFKSKKQLPLFMVWEEIWEGGRVVHAKVLFTTWDWIGR